jgi:hypothetical protein
MQPRRQGPCDPCYIRMLSTGEQPTVTPTGMGTNPSTGRTCKPWSHNTLSIYVNVGSQSAHIRPVWKRKLLRQPRRWHGGRAGKSMCRRTVCVDMHSCMYAWKHIESETNSAGMGGVSHSSTRTSKVVHVAILAQGLEQLSPRPTGFYSPPARTVRVLTRHSRVPGHSRVFRKICGSAHGTRTGRYHAAPGSVIFALRELRTDPRAPCTTGQFPNSQNVFDAWSEGWEVYVS